MTGEISYDADEFQTVVEGKIKSIVPSANHGTRRVPVTLGHMASAPTPFSAVPAAPG
jgi:hypothetical protein